MNRNMLRIAAVAAFATLAHGAAQANEWLVSNGSVIVGSGDNTSVSADTPRAAYPLSPAEITGSGENVTVRRATAPESRTPTYVAIIEGSGENLSVRHVPVPRG